jgi:ribosome biogenesis GTPase / thiamine phosphate phosphatase
VSFRLRFASARPALERLGWNHFFENQRIRLMRTDLQFARVIEEQRGAYRVDGELAGWVEVSGRLRHEAMSTADFPAVGDWVGIRGPSSGRPDGGERGIVEIRLDRRSTIARAAAGRVVDRQVIAANVDTIFVVTAFDRDLNPRRLERYLAIVWESGALPVILLNKADLRDDIEPACDGVRSRLRFVDVVAVSALRGDGLGALAPYLRAAQTVALIGSSGVGKSALVNRLTGGECQRVSGLDGDGKGRHTTTSRQLIELPGGALLIDTPGMRELQPWGDAAAIDATFDDIAALALECRFGDCSHEGEPGCAVWAAVDAGRLDPDRLENYRRLLRELAFERRKRDKAAAAEAKRKLKRMMQAQKALYRDRDRS